MALQGDIGGRKIVARFDSNSARDKDHRMAASETLLEANGTDVPPVEKWTQTGSE